MEISGLQTLALPEQALIHFYMESMLLDRPRRHHTNPPDLDRPRRYHTNQTRRHHTSPWDLDRPRRHHTNRPRWHHTNRWGIMVDVTCSLWDSLQHFPHAWRFRHVCTFAPSTSGEQTGLLYRPAAPIQHFNNKSLNWPAWFRHFRAVADVHGWDKNQRAQQLVSYLDETAMNVAQQLGDDELYDYDILVKLLGDRFDPASRVSASRSRFHGRSRRHHEDADSFADAITELCLVGSKNTCGWWFVPRRTGNSRHWLRCVRILPALACP